MSRRAWIAGVLCLTGCRPALEPSAVAPPAVAARPVAPPPSPVPDQAGLEWVVADAGADEFGQPRRLAAVVVDLAAWQVKVYSPDQHAARWVTAAEAQQRLGAAAVLNGGYFDPQHRPLGYIVADGRVLQPLRRNSWPVLALRSRRAEVLDAAQVKGRGALSQAVQCGPRLVRAGRAVDLKDSPPRARSAAGVDDHGRLVLAATDHCALTLDELAALLAQPREAGGLGCRDALNLDGGPSTQFQVPGRIDQNGLYPMPSHLVVLPRKGSR